MPPLPKPLPTSSAPHSTTVQASEGLEGWLAEQRVALAFSTYRANRLLLLGRGEAGGLKMQERLFDRPMGLFAEGESLWMAARTHIWRLDNHLAPGLLHEGGDRLYVPANCAITGDVNAHELVVPTGGPWAGQPLFVNTAFSCLAGLERGCSFAPRWRPPFLKRLAADDACHLNGVALREGAPVWATACGHHGGASSWRNDRRQGGVVVHLPSDAVVGAELELKYAGYFDKERARAARLEAQGMVRLPAHLDYEALLTLSTEARQKLSRLRPGTLAQASAIPGISPADLQNLMMELRKARASI